MRFSKTQSNQYQQARVHASSLLLTNQALTFTVTLAHIRQSPGMGMASKQWTSYTTARLAPVYYNKPIISLAYHHNTMALPCKLLQGQS